MSLHQNAAMSDAGTGKSGDAPGGDSPQKRQRGGGAP